MSGENERDSENTLKKIVIDGLSNFRLQAAYIAYSEAYDKSTDLEVKKYLNQNMMDLQQNRIDYQTFYRNINRYRQIDSSQHQLKSSIKTQSKSEWRNQMRKIEREKRHK
ncbi:MAG: hypothetical protein N3E47_07705 [Candidatus Bathyarchaeota archaeon]|nr:hypothetical protein [Candidatus Bathyarchaeota archaeon]